MQTLAAQSRAGTLGPLRFLLAAVIILPLGLFGAAAWVNYRWSFEEAQAQLTRTTDAAHEHALKIFQAKELVLDRIAERFGGLDRQAIAADPAVVDYLKHLAEDVPHIAVLGFIAPYAAAAENRADRPRPTRIAALLRRE